MMQYLFLRMDLFKPPSGLGQGNDFVPGQTEGYMYTRKKINQNGSMIYSKRNQQHTTVIKFNPKPALTHEHEIKPWPLDHIYYTGNSNKRKMNLPRVVYIDPKAEYITNLPQQVFPAIPVLTSDYADKFKRELSPPLDKEKECVPMKDWQTSYYPTCNEIHQLDVIHQSRPQLGGDMHLFGTNGESVMCDIFHCGLNTTVSP